MGEQGGGAIRVGKHDEGPRTPGKRYLTPFFPDTVFPPAAYAPPGGLASLVNGHVSGGFAGITTGNSYNSRLFPTLLSASSSNGTALSLSYTYFANGNVNVETNGRDNGRSVTYAYDALSRVSTATSQATSGSDCWGQSFGYDRYANLTTVNVTQCTAPMLSLNVNTNNQISNSGFSYDSAGDLTADGVNTYSWNAEQHLNSAASVTYTYDGDLRRVKKSSGTLYWYCAICGQVLAESDLSGNLTSEYALFNKQRIARRDVASGNVYYLFHDRLGSYRTLTDSTGNVKGESDYYPFGGERVISSTVTDSFRFTGMEWDSEDSQNHTQYRQYTSAQGRWLTPDPKRGCVNFPQGQNLYAYVKDSPTNGVDPQGLSFVDCDDPWYAEGHPECPANPGALGPVDDGDGGGVGGGGSGLPGCDPSCCDSANFASSACMNCVLNCDGGGDGGDGGDTGKCTACTGPSAQGSTIAGAGDLCEDPEPYLIRSFQCTGGPGTNTPTGCCGIQQGIFQASCEAHGGHMVPANSATYSYAVCCSKTRPRNPAPGQPFPPAWYPPAC